MPWQDIAIALLTIGAGVTGWFLKTMWDAMDRLRTNLTDLERGLPEIYARRDDVREMFQQVLKSIDKLRDDLYNGNGRHG